MPCVQAGQRTIHWWILCRFSFQRRNCQEWRCGFKHPVSTIVGPISESEMVLRSSPPGYYQANIAMRSIFWPADSVSEHTDVEEGRTDSGDASITSSEHPTMHGCSYDEQGVAHQRSTEMCQSVWLPLVAHTTNPWRMAMFNTTGSLNQNLYPGRRRMLLTTSLDTDSGESCAEIRIIKYCAEPSVRELP